MHVPTLDAATGGVGVLAAQQTVQAGQVAVIGDVGGHTHALRRLLERLGVTFDLPRRLRVEGEAWTEVAIDWPAGLHIVQAGDLIHRGPDSPGAVLLVDRLMRAGHWTQVVGNHEQLYVDRRVFTWHEVLPQSTVDLLRSWWSDGLLRPAVAVTSNHGDRGDYVVTHAGVTHGFWDRDLDQAGSAIEVVDAIGATVASGAFWNPGVMLTGNRNLHAGPAWAEASHELYLSWILASEYHQAPFHQVHGHSSAFRWSGATWLCPEPVRPALKVDTGQRHVTATIAGARLTGTDPGHGRHAASVYRPLLVADATVHRR